MNRMMTLKNLISEILNKMFFMIEDLPPKEYSEHYNYLVNLDDSHFQLKMLFSKETAQTLSENMLGENKIYSEDVIKDCLKEVVNMIAGNLIGKFYPNHEKEFAIPMTLKVETNTQNFKEFDKILLFYDNLPICVFFKENI